jgi:hypothetical protein
MIDAEALQRGVRGLGHVLGPAVDAEPAAVGVALVAELGGDHDLVSPAGDRSAHQLLVGERAVHVGGVQQVDASV